MSQGATTKWVVGSVASALLASSALAQTPTARLTGTVRDSSGSPVALAQLTVLDVRSLSDSTGRFVLDALPAGSGVLRVRRLGFAPLDVSLLLAEGRTDSVMVVLAMVARALPELTTTDAGAATRMSDFNRHRQSGQGHYFNRKEIEERKVQRLSDLVRRVPGVRLLPDRAGRYQLRMTRTAGNCPPDFYLDGIRAPFLNVDDVPLNDIEALEVYRGNSALPPEFNSRLGNPSCGAIVIWTRAPG